MRQFTTYVARGAVWAILALAVALISPAPANAQTAPAPEYQRLGLSADQMARVRALHQETNQSMRRLERQLREQRQALEVVYREYDMDTARARQINARINEIQRAILEQHQNLQTNLRKILTAEQFGRLKSMMDEHRTRERTRPRSKPS